MFFGSYTVRKAEILKYFLDQMVFAINKSAQSNSFTSFEKRAFEAIYYAASFKATRYLKDIYFKNKTIKNVDNVSTLEDAYIFMCAAELYLFICRWEGGLEIIAKLQDVSIEKFFTDFSICIGDAMFLGNTEMAEDYFAREYKLFQEALLSNDYDLGTFFCPDNLADNDDYRSLNKLRYFQSLLFGNIMSEGKIDFLPKALNDTANGTLDAETIEFVLSLQFINSIYLVTFDEILLGIGDVEGKQTLITCNKCGQVLKIPMGQTLRVTCSKCKCVLDYSTKTGSFECGCCAALFGSFAMGKAGNKRWKEKGPKAVFKKMGVGPSSKEASTIMPELVVCEWEDTTEEACGHATIGFCKKCGIPLCREHVYSG